VERISFLTIFYNLSLFSVVFLLHNLLGAVDVEIETTPFPCFLPHRFRGAACVRLLFGHSEVPSDMSLIFLPALFLPPLCHFSGLASDTSHVGFFLIFIRKYCLFFLECPATSPALVNTICFSRPQPFLESPL